MKEETFFMYGMAPEYGGKKVVARFMTMPGLWKDEEGKLFRYPSVVYQLEDETKDEALKRQRIYA